MYSSVAWPVVGIYGLLCCLIGCLCWYGMGRFILSLQLQYSIAEYGSKCMSCQSINQVEWSAGQNWLTRFRKLFHL
jgi:hypothetical protein